MGMPNGVFQCDVPAKNKILDKLSSNIAWYNKPSTHVRENNMFVVIYNEWLFPYCYNRSNQQQSQHDTQLYMATNHDINTT